MIEFSQRVLKECKYEEKEKRSYGHMFDGLTHYEGWQYLHSKIYQLPRCDKLVDIINQSKFYSMSVNFVKRKTMKLDKVSQ